MLCDFPSIHLVSPETNVRYQRSVFAIGSVKQLHSTLTGYCDGYLEPSIRKGIFDDTLNEIIVFNDQDNKEVFQAHPHYPLLRCSIPDSLSTNSRIGSTGFEKPDLFV